MKASRRQTLFLLLIVLSLSACNKSTQKPRVKIHKVRVSTVQSKDVTLTHQYVGMIKSHRYLNVRAYAKGFLEPIPVKEGQEVKKGDLLFQIRPTLEKEPENAEKMVFILAPFDGMIDRLLHHEGNLVQQGDLLTTLSDNSEVWVYFNVPEKRYLEYMSANVNQYTDDLKIELVLANGSKFDHPGKLSAIAADFNHQTGSIPFRVDFPNPDRLLRHGQAATLFISRVQNDAIVVPQRATFELLNKRYVYVLDKDNVAHQRQITVQNEFEDQFVVKTGVAVDDKIVVDGVRLIHDGEKVECEDRDSKKVAAKLE